MDRLDGKRVVLTASRKVDELSKIVQKLGGIPIVRPIQGSVSVEQNQVENKISWLLKSKVDWIILTTGVGTEILYQTAENMGVADNFVEKLRQSRIAARGYKTVKYLKTLGIEPTVRDDDGTTKGIIRALAAFDLRGQQVMLQLYGDHAPRLQQWLKEQQADVYEILPYIYTPPELAVVNSLISDIGQGEVDAVTFTSTSQVRFLMKYAKEKGIAEQVIAAFRDIVAVAVGKVTAEALKEEGIERVITPNEERMGSMIIALAKYYEEVF